MCVVCVCLLCVDVRVADPYGGREAQERCVCCVGVGVGVDKGVGKCVSVCGLFVLALNCGVTLS